MNKFKIFMILIVIGFLFISIDSDINTGIKFPVNYENTEDVIGEFQYYNIYSNYHATCTYKMLEGTIPDKGALIESMEHEVIGSVVIDKVYFENIYVDIFNDYLGFLFIFIACIGFAGCSRKFKFGAFSAILSLFTHGTMMALPFFTNGIVLCNLAFALGIAYLGVHIITMYFVASGLFAMIPDICCRDERKWDKILYVVIISCQILLTFVMWIGSDYSALAKLGVVIEISLLALIIGFFKILKRADVYLEKTYNQSLTDK